MMALEYCYNYCRNQRKAVSGYYLLQKLPRAQWSNQRMVETCNFLLHSSSFLSHYSYRWKRLTTNYLRSSPTYCSFRYCSGKGTIGEPKLHHRLERATHRLLEAPLGSLTAGKLEELSTAMSYWSTDRRTDCVSYKMVEALRIRLLQEEEFTGQPLLTTSICQSIMEGWIKCSAYSTKHQKEPLHTIVLNMQQLLDHMVEQYRSGNKRMKPNDFVFSLVMDGWADLCDSQYGVVWKENPFYPAKQAQNLLSLMEDLYQLEGRKPNTTCYNIAIKAWAKSASKIKFRMALDDDDDDVPAAAKAESILMKMLEWYRLEKDPYTSRAPDATTFNTVMYAWAESVHLDNYASKAEHILNLMISFSREQQQLFKESKFHANRRHSSAVLVRPNTVSYTTVISAYATSPVRGGHLKAQQLLRDMEELGTTNSNLNPNTYTYNAVIKAFARSGSNDAPYQAEALLHRMIKKSQDGHFNHQVFPDLTSYNTVLHAWALSKHTNASDRAQELLRQMKNVSDNQYSSAINIRPDIISYNTVCDAIAKSRKEDSAERILRTIEEMRQCNIKPDTTTFNTLLSAYIRSGSKTTSNAEGVLSMMQYMYDSGNEHVKPDLFTYNQVLDAYAKSMSSNASKKAIKLLDEMQNKYGVKPDTVTFGSAIAACANSGCPTSGVEAESLLAMMINKYEEGGVHVKPNTFCFNGVINAYIKSGDKNAVDHAEAIFRRMQEYNVKPNNVSFSLMIHAHTKCGKQASTKHAETLLEEMQAKYNVAPDVVTFNTVLCAIANSREADAAQRAEKMLIRMIQKKLSNETSVTPDSVSFASVINAWAYSGRYNSDIAKGAWRVLRQQLELMNSGFSDRLRPTIHHFNEVLKACCYTKGAREVKHEALNIAAQVFDYLQTNSSSSTTNNVSCKANHTTYALFINTGVRHLDRECDADKKRNLIKYAFRTCLKNAKNGDESLEGVLQELHKSSSSKTNSEALHLNRPNNEYYQILAEEVRSEMS